MRDGHDFGVLCCAQVWSVGQPTPNFTLEGHEKGVNCIDYFVGGAHTRPHLSDPEGPASRGSQSHELAHLRSYSAVQWPEVHGKDSGAATGNPAAVHVLLST